MMKALKVPFIENSANFDELSTAFQQINSHKIAELSWLEYPYLPDVDFKIGYSHKSILLKYNVQEKHFKAIYRKINEPVYRDSCVEFFISFDKEHYYNFEFNSLGTALVGYGTENRALRQHLPIDLVEKIKARGFVTTTEEAAKNTKWVLHVEIPFELFYMENIESLKGVCATANFYKCGDDLPEPHFVSWNKIDAPLPNFHLPEYFGEIEFV